MPISVGWHTLLHHLEELSPEGVVTGGNLGLIEDDLEPGNDRVAAIDRALTRMETLIDEILTLARDGRQVEQWDAVRLSSVVEDCWEMVETADAEVVIRGDPVIEVDPDRLKRLFGEPLPERDRARRGGDDRHRWGAR
jgi:signal transduction histidine kinase